jgi:uncharacterized RDD family membrane protein YckC
MGDSTGTPEGAAAGAGPQEPRGPASLPGRLLGTGARGARRVARATGVESTAEALAEEAIVRAIESEAAERALARVLQGPAVEEAVRQILASPAVERALSGAIDSEMVDRVWGRLLASDEAQKLVERIADAPEVRAAIASQGAGLIDDLGRGAARATHRLDDAAERLARLLLRRPRREGEARQAGLVSRALALRLDGAILNAGFFAISAVIAMIASLFAAGDPDATTPTIVIGTGLWLMAGAVYVGSFWALAGQTPGMRFLRIRLDSDGLRRIGARRAVRRLAGLVLAAIPLGLGFLGVLLTERRRGWPDRIAGTEVLYVITSPRPAPWSGREQA